MFDEAHRRDRMVERQLAARGIVDPRVLEAMRSVPREAFVPADRQHDAYADSPLPIEDGQTISQPYIVAVMAEAAALQPADRVLEVGAGSGYASAVLSLLAARVHAIERQPRLAATARERLDRLGYGSVVLRCGDGSTGWAEAAPFDAILVAAGGPSVPAALRQQLAPGGRLIMPVGESLDRQHLVKLTRTATHAFREEDLGPVAFVPLVGAQGWPEDLIRRKHRI